MTYESAKGGATFPQTPMQIKLGTWVAGGKNSPPGTVQWAGGYTDFSKAPFLGYYKSIAITDYAGKDKPANGGVKEYIYGDQTGTYQSIKVVGGDSSSDSSSSSSSGSATGTQTSSGAQSSTKASASGTTTKAASTTGTSAKTTLTTAAASTGSNSTTTAASTATGSGTSPTGSTTPTTVPGSGAPRGAAAVGSVLLAGVGVMVAQMLL